MFEENRFFLGNDGSTTWNYVAGQQYMNTMTLFTDLSHNNKLSRKIEYKILFWLIILKILTLFLSNIIFSNLIIIINSSNFNIFF